LSVLDHFALQQALTSEALEDRLIVTPLLDRVRQLGQASIDLRLDSSFIVVRRSDRGGVDPLIETAASVSATRTRLTVPFGEGLWLHPGEMVLGGTLEYIRLPKYLSAYVMGRSTWGRLGLIVATAIMVHPGFSGSLTLELVNTSNSPLRLYPGLRIAQLALHKVAGQSLPASPNVTAPDDGLQRSQYSGSTRAQAPKRAWTEDEMERIRALAGTPSARTRA
jgi:dCTP deaminase